MTCEWPSGTCACYAQSVQKQDPHGRVWMHCEEGLSLNKASMSRLVMHCLENNIEIGTLHPFNYRHKNCTVIAAVRLRPDQFSEFERVTKGRLRHPPRVSLNSSSPETITGTG